jgi:hypothetical protein
MSYLIQHIAIFMGLIALYEALFHIVTQFSRVVSHAIFCTVSATVKHLREQMFLAIAVLNPSVGLINGNYVKTNWFIFLHTTPFRRPQYAFLTST